MEKCSNVSKILQIGTNSASKPSKMGIFSPKREPYILGRTSYPAYCISPLGDAHLVIGGGGGAAKTGVPNRIDVYQVGGNVSDLRRYLQISPTTSADATPNRPLSLAHVRSIDTGPSVSMCLQLTESNGVGCACAGQDEMCRIYSIHPTVIYSINDEVCESPPESIASDVKQLNELRHLSYEFTSLRAFRSDYHAKDAFLKCVAIQQTQNAEHVVTAGADGHVRVFKTSTGAKVGEHHAHQTDVDSLDMSPDGAIFISIGRNKKWFVYRTNDVSRLVELPTPPIIENSGGKFKPRLVKFTKLGKMSYIFVAAFVPVAMDRRNNRSFLTLWSYNTQRNAAVCIVAKQACKHVISALAVSMSGDYTAIGTQSPGSVGIHDTHTMTQVYYVHETHDIFVTGVAFLPAMADKTLMQSGRGKDDLERLPTLTSDYRCAVVSISGDQTIQLHTVAHEAHQSLIAWLVRMSVIAWVLYLMLTTIGL